jgi:hypothetical protein
MPLPLYSQGKSPRYPLHRRLGGSQSRSGCCGVGKIFIMKFGGKSFLEILVIYLKICYNRACFPKNGSFLHETIKFASYFVWV